jgi:hypothetical protein
MLKEKAVASWGQQSLLMPAWVKAALLANDRLKLYPGALAAVMVPDEALIERLRSWGASGVKRSPRKRSR